MEDLTQQRCLNHPLREAVARCPECRLFFCRECVTEHDDRSICAGCLRKLAKGGSAQTRRFASALRLGALAVGVLTALLCFYALGRELTALPSEFHDGSVWKVNAWEDP